MVSRTQTFHELIGLLGEVDLLQRRIRWVAGALDDHEVEAIGERSLRRPRHRAGADAAMNEDDPVQQRHDICVNKVGRKSVFFVEKWRLLTVTNSAMLAAMERSRPTFEPAGAGMLLAATTAASVGIGALIGWAAGGVGYGILGGAIVGVPAGIVAVYYRYREALS